jgi:hypothetical protein
VLGFIINNNVGITKKSKSLINNNRIIHMRSNSSKRIMAHKTVFLGRSKKRIFSKSIHFTLKLYGHLRSSVR